MNELLRLFVTLEARGDKDISKVFRRLETEGEAVEERLSGIGGGMEDSAKKTETAGQRMSKAIRGVGREAKDLDGTNVTLNTELKGAGQVTQSLEAIKNRQKDLDRSKITLSTSLKGAKESIGELTRLEGVSTRIDGDKVTLTAEVDGTEQGRTALASLQQAANRLDGDDIRMKAEVVGAPQAIGELAEIGREADRLDGREVNIRTDRSVGALNALGDALTTVATRMRALQTVSVAAVIPGLVAAIGAIPAIVTPAVAALGALAGAMGAGLAGAAAVGAGALGTFAGAVGLIATPVTMLLSKLGEYDKSLDKISSKQSTAANAANTLASAERSAAKAAQGVADARISAAEGVAAAEKTYQDALRGVEDAERTLARTRRDAAEGVMDAREQAAKDIAQAEQDAVDALRDVEDAEQALTDARIDAGEAAIDLLQAEHELADLRDGDEARNLAEAEDNLTRSRLEAAEKQERYNEAVKEHGANSREAQLAALDLRDAQRDVAEQEEETNEIRRFGSEELRRAKDNYRDAARGQYDAAQRVTEAEENLALARETAAQKQAAIETARVEGAKEIAEAQRDGAEQVADAQRALTDAQRQASEAQAGIAKAQADGQRQIADAMARQEEAQLAVAEAADKLAEAERGVLDEIIPLTAAQKLLYDEFQRFKGIATAAFTPAMDQAARLGVEILALGNQAMPALGRASLATMQALTRAFGTIRAELMAPVEQAGFARFLAFIPQWVDVAAVAVGRLGIAFFNVFVHTLPYVMDFTNWLGQLATRFLAFTRSAEGARQINQFLAYSVMRAKELFAAIGNLAAGFYGLFAAFEQAGLVDQVWGGFVRLTEQFRQFTAAGSQGRASIVQFSQAAQPILSALWSLVEALVVQWFRVANAVMTMRDEMGRLVLPQALKDLQSALPIIGDLLIEAFRNFGPFIGPIVRGLAEFLKYAIALNPVLQAMTRGFAWLLTKFSELSPGMKTAIASAASLRIAFAIFVPVLTALFSPLTRVLGLIGMGGGLAGIAPRAAMALRGLGLAFTFATGPVGLIIAGLVALGAGLVIAYRRSEAFRNVVNGLFNFLRGTAVTTLTALRTAWTAAWTAISAVATRVWGGLRLMWRGFWNVVKGIFTSNTNQIRTGLMQWSAGIKRIKQTLINVALVLWRGFWSRLSNLWRQSTTRLKITFENWKRALVRIIQNFIMGALNRWRDFWNRAGQLWQGATTRLRIMFENWKRAIVRAIQNFVISAYQKWQAFWNRVQTLWQQVTTRIRIAFENWKRAVVRAIQNFVTSAYQKWQAFWDRVTTLWSDKMRAIREKVEGWKQRIIEIFNSMPGPVREAFEAVGRAMTDPIGTAWDVLKGIFNAILEGMAKVAGAVGLDGVAEKLRGVKFGEGDTAGDRAAPQMFARGGVYKADRGGIAGPGRIGIVGEAQDDEAIVNLRRRTPESQAALRAANRSPNATHRGTGPPIGNETLAKRNAGRGPGMRQEGFGPAMYTLVKPLKDIADKIAAKHGTPWNTYSNHPPGASPQPYWRERSVDWWGSGGRGDPIGNKWTGVARDAMGMLGGNLEYMLTPSNDPAGHWDHVHVSAFIGQDHPLATGSGPSGGGILASLWQTVGNAMWDRLVQKPWDNFKADHTDGKTVPAQILGGAGDTLLNAIKEKFISESGSTSGGPGTNFTGGGDPAKNRALGEKMNAAAGWRIHWGALDSLWTKESGWNHLADNPTSDAYGIPQAMTSAHNMPAGYGPPGGDPAVQIDWGLGYIRDRYGNPSQAWNHSQATGWYEKGGQIPGRAGDPKSLMAHAGEIVLPQGVSDNFIKFTEWMRELVERLRRISGMGSRSRVQGVSGTRGAPQAYNPDGTPLTGRAKAQWEAEFRSNDLNSPNRHKPGYVQAEDGSWVPTSFYNSVRASGNQTAEQNRSETHITESGGGSSYIVTHNGKVVAQSGNATAGGGARVGNIGAGVINRGAIHRPGMNQPWQLNIRMDDGLRDEMADMKRTLAAALKEVELGRGTRNDIKEGQVNVTRKTMESDVGTTITRNQLSNITRTQGSAGVRNR